MARIKGINEFNKAMVGIKRQSAILREQLDKKQDWYNNHSDYWKLSVTGRIWERYIMKIHAQLEVIEHLQLIDVKFKIIRGQISLNSGGHIPQ